MSKAGHRSNKLDRKENRLERQIKWNAWADRHSISLPSGPFINPRYQKFKDFKSSAPKQVDVEVFGAPIPLNYGTFRHKCDIIWADDILPTLIQVDDRDEPFQEKWQSSFAVKVCEGEQGSLLRVWFNNVLVYDFTQTNSDGYSSTPNFANRLTFYPGSETQLASPVIEAVEGVGFVQGFRGTCYIVFKDIPLGRFNNEVPNVEAEVASLASPDYTTYNVPIVTPNTADIENFVISRASGVLYQYSAGTLNVISRNAALEIQPVNIQAALDLIVGSCTVTGIIGIDESESGEIEPVYFLCDSAGSAFILRYDGAFTNNYADRIAGVTNDTCFINGQRLYTSDGTRSNIRCYDKTSLSLLWTRSGPPSTSDYDSGNYTVDNGGNVWTVWLDTGDFDALFLTKITPGGLVKNFTITSSSGLGARGIMFDTQNNYFIVGGVTSNKISTVSNTSTPAIVASDTNRTCDNSRPLFASQYQTKNGFYCTDDVRIYRVKTIGLELKETITLNNFADTGTGSEAYAYGYIERAFWICRDASPGLSKLPLNRFQASGQGLDSVITDLATRAGLGASDIDVSLLTSLAPAGFAVLDREAARGPIESLMTAYQLGVREHFENGYSQIKIQWVRRSEGASLGIITEDLLGIGDGAPEDQSFESTRVNEEDLPLTVHVRYADVRRAYDSHVQRASIPSEVTAATREMNLDFPTLVLTDDEAKQLADSTLSTLQTENENVFLSLPHDYLILEPDDVFTVEYSGLEYNLRVEDCELGANYILHVNAVVTDVSTYISESTGSPAEPSDPQITIPSGSRMILVDCPAVRDVDGLPDDAGFYLFAAPGQSDALWPGCRVARSKDGLVFGGVGLVTTGATYGISTVALGDGETEVFDSESTITIQVQNGSLTTHTQAEVQADGTINLAAIGTESGGWEIVNFSTVVENEDGTTTITGMCRGRFGTESYVSTHAVGEIFVLFDFVTNATRRVKMPLSDIDTENIYRAVTIGAPISNAAKREFTNTARGLMPYPLREDHIIGAHNEPAANDWTVNFKRRTRIGFELQDLFDEAVNEEEEKYEIEIRDSPTGAVVRTITVGPGLPVTTGFDLQMLSSTVVRLSGSFLTDGFLVGQKVDLSGFTNAGNNKRYKISALSALVMTLTNGGTPVNEASAAGRGVTGATPAFCYTSAQQTSDGGSKPSFYMTVYQISGRLADGRGAGFGRGFGTQVLITT